MELNRLTRDADDLIRKVVSRYNQLYVPAGTISQLELDLMLDDLRKLYDTFKHIGYINLTLQDTLTKPEVKVNTAVPSQKPGISSDQQPAAPATPIFSEKQYISPEPTEVSPQPQAEPESLTEPETENELFYKSGSDNATPDMAVEELITESAPETVVENQESTGFAPPEIEESIPEAAENTNPETPEPAPAMLADKFNLGSKSLSETMASAQAKSVMGSRLQFQPIADLITGIGLNDKFSIISDLFGNSAEKYDEAIHRINKAVNLDEANWILQKYHSAEWEHKHETLARLKDFVKRRFI